MNAQQGDIRPSSASKDLVVFSILRESKCAECGEEVGKGSLLFTESGRPLCLRCADLDHLVFLPSGDAALTRRAIKYSTLSAVVVCFSRSRCRYERQGILVRKLRSSALKKNASMTPIGAPPDASAGRRAAPNETAI